MPSIILLGSIGLLVALIYFLVKKGEFNWNITVPIHEDNYSKVLELFDQFKFYEFHPLYDGVKLISEDKENNEKVFEIREKLLDTKIYKHVASNQAKFKKIAPNEYLLEVKLGACGFPLTLFRMEFTIYKNEIVEKANISGSYLMSMIVHSTGMSVHQKMLNNLKKGLENN